MRLVKCYLYSQSSVTLVRMEGRRKKKGRKEEKKVCEREKWKAENKALPSLEFFSQ